MTWWEAVLCTLGVIGFWPAYALVGDIADRHFQDWQSRRLADGVETMRRERLAREGTIDRG